MSSNFRKTAQAVTSVSVLADGKDKIKTRDIIDNYPDGVTITAFDVIEGQKGYYPLFNFKEDSSKFFNGGLIFMKIVNAWLDAYDGDIEKCNEDLKAEGGVKVKLELGTTKNGNNITKVKIV